jgi:hypothetical protein
MLDKFVVVVTYGQQTLLPERTKDVVIVKGDESTPAEWNAVTGCNRATAVQ